MIEKIIFRKSIKEVLLKYMLNGHLKPNERLSMPELASKLEISVTPIREALTQLTETGIVTYKENRGFFVTELNKSEAIELYTIIALLEQEAIGNCTYHSKQIKELLEINKAFSIAVNNEDKINFDKLFHQKLIENYTNQSAKKIIENIRIRLSIYELNFMDLVSSEASFLMHQTIITYLEQNNISEAKKELNKNWQISIEHLMH